MYLLSLAFPQKRLNQFENFKIHLMKFDDRLSRFFKVGRYVLIFYLQKKSGFENLKPVRKIAMENDIH